VYNECICPTSFFLGDAPPDNLQIMATVGNRVSRVLPYQDHRAAQLYGTDCGSYSVRVEPALSDLLFLESVDGTYTDRIRLGPATESQVGIYNVQMIVEQDVAAG
jgi:hypothetical protein